MTHRYGAAGYTDVRSVVYSNMMHEVLNETENWKVYQDVVAFLDESVDG